MSRKATKKAVPPEVVAVSSGSRRPKVLDALQLKAAQLLGKAGYVKGQRRRTRIVETVAHEVGVNHDTIYRWCELPEFLDTIEWQRMELLQLADAGLRDLLTGKLVQTKEGQVWVPPNATAIIFVERNLNHHIYDDQARRDRLKRQHDKDMLALKKAKIDEIFDQLPDIIYREVDGTSDKPTE